MNNTKIYESIDKLFAYDQGATDSGCNCNREETFSYLRALDEIERHTLLSFFARRYMTHDSIIEGYGLATIEKFINWLYDNNISY